MITILAKKDWMSLDQTNLRFSDDVKAVLKLQAEKRAAYRAGSKGFSKDKTWMDLGSINSEIIETELYQRMFPPDLPAKDRAKRREEFFRSNPNLKSNDARI